jgi:hypothetical protein
MTDETNMSVDKIRDDAILTSTDANTHDELSIWRA